MQISLSKPIIAACMSVLFLTPSCSTQVGSRVNVAAYPFLAHAGNNEAVVWRKYTGPDFDVFYGQPKKSKDSGFGFYRGGHPNFVPSEGALRAKGRLGAFDFDWFQTSTTGSVHQAAEFDYQTRILKFKNREQEFRFTKKIHVWVYGVDQRQIETLTEYLSGLELFREKPKDQIEIQ
jgi:hypothetical protein